MKQNSRKNYVITSLALYFTYFIHGIGASDIPSVLRTDLG